MAARRGSRFIKPLLYTAGAGAIGTAALYVTLRPRDIPGTEAAAVPPPTYGEGGVFRPPQFPNVKSRDEQIADLKRSGGVVSKVADKAKTWLGGSSTTSPVETVEDEPYDLLIIGGGATGTGIALDAVTRGLKVAMVERDDFSSGTSSKSTKLVHGGVRYLEKAVWNLDYNQYKLVVEALRERRYFLDTAPHLSQWLPIMIPLQKWWQAPYFWVGTKFYDFLAGKENIESSYFLTKSKALDAFPMLKKEGLVGALVYYDGAHNDSRMNVSLAMTAALYGATVVSHLEITSLEKDANGRLCGAKAKDCVAELNGKKAEEFTIKAKGIINATGPFTDSIRKMDDQTVEEIVAPSSGVHVILPGYYSPANMGLIDPNTSDGRVIFFLPWQGNTIAGTTDTACDILQNPVAGEEEIDWILKEVKRYLQPDINVRRGDVLAAWSGIRPLVRDPKAGKTEGLVRNHLVTTSPSGLLTCSGGKWTTYRQMAEETVDEAIKEYGLQPKSLVNPTLVSGTEVKDELPLDGTCQTHRVRLVGAHGYSKTLFINLIQHFGLETDVAKYLCQAYGDRAWTVAALSAPTEQRFPVRGVKISGLYPFIDGEVRYCVRHEYAQTATDVIARRMRLAFLNAQAALEALPKVIDIMSEELNWDAKRKETEWKNSVSYLGSMGLPKNKLALSRKDVEAGHVGKYTDEDYHLYARHGESDPDEEACADLFSMAILLNKTSLDKPDELLESDSKFPKGHNPVVGKDSSVNK
ncbi:DAO-domain-containing protein [Clathrospora elynae]|uniref:Glycerol-3-phosphate dehydrogenase n=1 Tax=Clathrospora elynae TaxID=706981 RepID=A0A6A5SME5_9PLEO|nr:DAO-domain-containing protein [Clathrospora elynae]